MTKTKKIKIVKKKLQLDGAEKLLVIKGLRSNIKALESEGEGIIEAYVSVFGNVDSYGDIVEKGAFADAIINNFPRYPKGIWAHDWSQPIAKTLEIREDERGLYIKAQLILSVQKAREAWDLIKAGVMTDFSFGYEINESEFDTRGFRHLKKLTPYEWSPVLVGANNQATIVGVKTADQEAIEEEVEVPENTPVAGEEKPESEIPEPVTPKPEGETETDEQKKALELEEKAGRVLSAKNVSLIKGAMSSIDGAITGLSDAKNAFEALLKAVEDPSEEDGKGKAVEEPHKEEFKNILKGVRLLDKGIEQTIIRLKKITE